MIFKRIAPLTEPTENKLFSTVVDFKALRAKKESTHEHFDYNCEYCGIDVQIPSFSESASFKKPFLALHDIMITKYYHMECKRLHRIEKIKTVYKPQSKISIANREALKRIDKLKNLNK